MADLENEEWRLIPGFPGYEASSLGRVRSIDRLVKQGNRWGQVIEKQQKGRILSPRIDRYGYHKVNPCVNGRVIYTGVHRLVCAAFHGPNSSKMAAHNDGNPSNNRPENLRWATAKENASDMILHGTRLCGSRNPNARLGVRQISRIRSRSAEPLSHLAADFGISSSQVLRVINGESWGHIAGSKDKPRVHVADGVNPNQRLMEQQVLEIRRRSDEPSPALAVEFGISESQILNIIHGRSWKHLPGAKPKPSCSMRKLTDDQRQEVIRSLLSGAELGRRYGVSKEAIYAIRKKAKS